MSNPFPGKRVPEAYQRLQMIKFYEGGLNYTQLQDGEVFEAAYTYMCAYQDAEKIQHQREEAKARATRSR